MFRGFVKLKNNDTLSVSFDQPLESMKIGDFVQFVSRNNKKIYMINSEQISYIDYEEDQVREN